MPQAKELWDKTMIMLAIAADKSEQAWQELEQQYVNHGRHYHTLTHIDKMCELMEQFEPNPPPELRFAVFFHDAIYDTTREDNEEQSALLATKVLSQLGINGAVQSLTSKLILCTKIHQPRPGDLAAMSGLFLDLDLLILASTPIEYDAYAAKIHKEYAWVPEAQYKAGRAHILNAFLERPFIYFTEEIRKRHERAARENIQRELSTLGVYTTAIE